MQPFSLLADYMLYFDIYFGTECFLNSCTGVILFSGMQKFRVPKEELAENPTCHSITKFVDDPLESLRLFIAWAIVAAVLCFCGSVALSMVLKWGAIPGNKLKDDPVLKMHDKLRVSYHCLAVRTSPLVTIGAVTVRFQWTKRYLFHSTCRISTNPHRDHPYRQAERRGHPHDERTYSGVHFL
nr:uncharacterized protein LOC126540064 [Dermacentor andersoni]